MMTKRKAAANQNIKPKMLAIIKNRNVPFDDAFWRNETKHDAWLIALDRLDRLGNKEPLKELLRLNLPPKIGDYVADLIERRCVPIPKGRPRTPAYTISRAEAKLLAAHDSVKAYVQRGWTVKVALEKVATERNLDHDQLANSYKGRRGSMNRSRQHGL
jgi:hypothetical protein